MTEIDAIKKVLKDRGSKMVGKAWDTSDPRQLEAAARWHFDLITEADRLLYQEARDG